MTFLSVVEIESALRVLYWFYPGITELIPLPYKTYEEKSNNALLIRGDSAFKCRPAIVLISGVHAREWGGPDILVYLAADLLDAYTHGAGLAYGGRTFTANEVRSIVDGTDIVVFPDVNPDGRAYSMAGAPFSEQANWRKNRNKTNGGGAGAGVDINRNYDFLWDFPTKFSPDAEDTIGSTDPANHTYHGPAPFTEAESKNVRWLVDRFPNTRWLVDVHSYGGDVLYSWGDDENQTTDNSKNFLSAAWDRRRGVEDNAYGEYIPATSLARLQAAAAVIADAIEAVRGERYATEQGFWLRPWTYPTSGTSRDWSFSRHLTTSWKRQIHSFTIEFNTSETIKFFPTWPQMELIIADVDAGLLALLRHARPTPLELIRCWFVQAISWIRDQVLALARRLTGG